MLFVHLSSIIQTRFRRKEIEMYVGLASCLCPTVTVCKEVYATANEIF